MPEKDIKEAKSLQKSVAVATSPRFIMTKWPGQVPSKENLELMRQVSQMPAPMHPARLLNHEGSYLSPTSVLEGLGLDRGKQNEWKEFLGKAISAPNELVMRQSLLSKMLFDQMDSGLRKALFQRTLSYYRDMRKSMVNVVTVDELRKANGIVDEGEQGDPDGRLERIIRIVTHRLGSAGPEGLSLKQLSDVVRTYGQPLVAKALEKACAQDGAIIFRKGMLLSRGTK